VRGDASAWESRLCADALRIFVLFSSNIIQWCVCVVCLYASSQHGTTRAPHARVLWLQTPVHYYHSLQHLDCLGVIAVVRGMPAVPFTVQRVCWARLRARRALAFKPDWVYPPCNPGGNVLLADRGLGDPFGVCKPRRLRQQILVSLIPCLRHTLPTHLPKPLHLSLQDQPHFFFFSGGSHEAAPRRALTREGRGDESVGLGGGSAQWGSFRSRGRLGGVARPIACLAVRIRSRRDSPGERRAAGSGTRISSVREGLTLAQPQRSTHTASAVSTA